MLLASVLVCAVFATSACAAEAPKPTPTPTKTAVFASEEDALQAAIDVYQKYSAVVDRVTSEGDESMSDLEGLVTAEYLESYETAESFEDRGWHTTGTSSFRNEELVDLAQTADTAEVQIALCRDLSKVTILDASSDDITAETRQRDQLPYSVRAIWNTESSTLLISETGTWDDASIC